MIEKRFQVFLSSTYTDLIEERNEVMQALLELECMPAGMELFPATNETQWNWIKKVIEESDYYIIIMAGRYGSISPQTGISYTEMEYRYALDIGKPIIGFLHEDPNSLPHKLMETEPSSVEKLNIFRDFVKSKLCKYYSSPADLGAKVSRSITQLKKQYPAIGWIRADEIENYSNNEDYIKLTKENDSLKTQLKEFDSIITKQNLKLASGDDEITISFYFIRKTKNPEPTKNNWIKVGEDSIKIKTTWNNLFSKLAIIMIKGSASYRMNESTATSFSNKFEFAFFSKYKEDKYEELHIDNEEFDRILLQFRALGYLSYDTLGREWMLTKSGNEFFTQMIALKKGEGAFE